MSEHEILEKLSQNDTAAFTKLVESFYTRLCRIAIKYTRHPESAEEIVQDVFVAVWNKRHSLEITASLSAYLGTAVKYRSINYLKSELRKPRFEAEFPESVVSNTASPEDQLKATDLQQLIGEALESLPKKCRIIFDLSRNAEMTYKEIAAELNISQKTVETQMSIALSKMKEFLGRKWDKLACFLLILFT
jgi:RNA polymerase sigma-70 factor (ECF subfamily)